jgi:hypothetical protein
VVNSLKFISLVTPFALTETWLYMGLGNDWYRILERSKVTGTGGHDVTTALTRTTAKIDVWWKALSPAQRSTKINQMWSINGWDISPLADNMAVQRQEFGGPDWAPRSVTVNDEVHYAHEVNYFFWGYLNGLASKNGQSVSKAEALNIIYAYRTGAGAAFVTEAYDGTMGGRAAWAAAGWDYAMSGNFETPSDVALPLATPSNTPYAGYQGSGAFHLYINKERVLLP